MKFLVDDNVEFSEAQRAEAEAGVDWLKNWLTERHQDGKFVDRVSSDYSDADVQRDAATGDVKYNECMEALENPTICVVKVEDGKTPAECTAEFVKKQVLAGNLQFTDEYLAQYGGNLQEAVDAFTASANSGDSFLGLHQSEIKGNVVFITDEVLLKDTRSVVTHECAHMLKLEDSEIAADPDKAIDGKSLGWENEKGEYLFKDIAVDDYQDSGMEIYARTMQFRQMFGLDPIKIYTAEDIAEIRQKHEAGLAEYKIKLGLDPTQTYSGKELQDAEKAHPEVTETPLYDKWYVLSRYTDEQIALVLNTTSQVNGLNGQENISTEDLIKDMKLYANTTFAKVRMLEVVNQGAQHSTDGNVAVTPAKSKETPQTTLSPADILRYSSGNSYT